MCADHIADHHGHVVDVEERRLMCVCRPCHLLFVPEGVKEGRFRAVPERVVDLGADAITPQQWDQLQIPVAVAFFLHNSARGDTVALYPGPAGTTESLLALDAWKDLVERTPALADMEPDVEALLVRSQRNGSTTAHIVPVDRCYQLTGQLRSVWRGFDGGSDARRVVDEFFADLGG